MNEASTIPERFKSRTAADGTGPPRAESSGAGFGFFGSDAIATGLDKRKTRRISRVPILIFLALIAIFWVPFSRAASEKMFTVGISVWSGYPDSVQGFKEAMAAGGLIEGRNVRYLYGKSGIDPERQREIAEGFKAGGVDLVYSLTTPGTLIVKEVMPPDTPIVFSIVTYPADAGLIESFEYSGNNLVGTSNYVPLPQYVSLLKAGFPGTRSVAIFHRKGEPNSKIQAANMVRLFTRAEIRPIDREPSSLEEVRAMARDLVGEAEVFMTTTDTLMQGGGERILIEISLAEGIPILSSNKAGIEAGSTFGSVADFHVLGRMSGEMAARILTEKVRPAQLQSRLQDPPLILINRKSAKALGIQVPEVRLRNFRYVE